MQVHPEPAWFFDQKSWKNVKKTRKKVGKMCENQFEKLESRQEK